MTRREVMWNLTKEEAKNLKKNLTQEEKNNLSFENLRPDQRNSCIYGQISGNCDNERAIELIKTCCSRAYIPDMSSGDTLKTAKVNGNPKNLKRGQFWSSIEVFIYQDINQKNGNNEKLVKYLKGETNRLTFK